MRIRILFLFVLAGFGLSAQNIPFIKADQIGRWKNADSDTVYVLNFWATWCAPCVEELPSFEKLNKAYAGKPVKEVLINTDFKRITWVLVMAGTVILLGHYIDFFNMIMPATVGDQWFIGVSEISSVLFFLGLFIFVVFTALTKAPLLPKRNPYIEESKHFHY